MSACAQVRELKGITYQPPGDGSDDDLVGSGQFLEPSSPAGRFADGELVPAVGPFRSFTHHHRTGGDADANRERSRRAHALDRLHDIQSRAHAALGIVLVRDRPAEVDHHAVTQVLGDVAVPARHHPPAHLSIFPNDAFQFLGIEAMGQVGITHDVAEHHGELPALVLAGVNGFRGDIDNRHGTARRHSDRLSEFCQGLQEPAGITQVESQAAKITLAQARCDVEVDPVLDQRWSAVGKPHLLEPLFKCHRPISDTSGSHRPIERHGSFESPAWRDTVPACARPAQFPQD